MAKKLQTRKPHYLLCWLIWNHYSLALVQMGWLTIFSSIFFSFYLKMLIRKDRAPLRAEGSFQRQTDFEAYKAWIRYSIYGDHFYHWRASLFFPAMCTTNFPN